MAQHFRPLAIVGLTLALLTIAACDPVPLPGPQLSDGVQTDRQKSKVGVIVPPPPTTRDEGGCKFSISAAHKGWGDLTKGGPRVFGVLAEGKLVCVGGAASEIKMNLEMSRLYPNFGGRDWDRQPPGGWMVYEGPTPTLRAAHGIASGRYQASGTVSFVQNGRHYLTQLVLGPEVFITAEVTDP